jgi:hypothetical protein
MRFKYVNEGDLQTNFVIVQEFASGGTIDVNVVSPVVEPEILCPEPPRVTTFDVNGNNQTPPYTREPIILLGRESVQFRNKTAGSIEITNQSGDDGYTLTTQQLLTALVNPALSKVIPPQEWYNAYSFGTSNEELYDFLIESDGYVCAGWSGNDPLNTSGRSVLLTKIGFDGIVIWTHYYRDPANDGRDNTCTSNTHYCNDYWGVTVRAHPAGGYVIAGWTDAYSLADLTGDDTIRDDALLVKTHVDLTLDWIHHYDSGEDNADRAQGLCVLHNSSNVATGFAFNGWSYLDVDGITRYMTVVKTSLLGVEVARQHYGFPDGSWGYGILEVTETDGSHNIVAVGSFGYYGTWCGLYKLNPATLDTIWYHIYDDESASAWFTVVQDVAQCADGGYVITGWQQPRGSEYRRSATALKTDAGGDLEWQRTYKTDYQSHLYSGRQTTDGGYVLVGDIITDAVDNVERSLLIRADSLGNEVWRDTVPEGVAPYGAFNPKPVIGYSVREGEGGTIVVGGKDQRISHGTDIFLQRYKSNPTAWTFKYTGSGVVTDAIQRVEWK